MISKIIGAGIFGIKGVLICCEADIGMGLPGTSIIGYVSSEVREATDRVRTAIKNTDISLEPRKVVINLSPADIRKDGSAYDLPIAISILSAYGFIKKEELKDSVFVGELSLSGDLLPIRGILSIAIAVKEAGYKRLFVPKENAIEGSLIDEIECYGINNLKQLVEILNHKVSFPPKTSFSISRENLKEDLDFSDIAGQENLKRATMIAVAGRHHLLFIGPAGTGKSMIASRIPTIMPKLSKEEALTISQIHSICGILPHYSPLLQKRPFRSPHHTISMQALCGGGIRPKPGEISLATHGVLFLDEFAEFQKNTIEVLRQPLEEGKIQISRLYGSYEFPADFMLCCATNPCKCGFYPDRKRCHCSEREVSAYIGKISKPLLDRIDICIETKLLKYDELSQKDTRMDSATIRKKVERVQQIQRERFQKFGILYNAQMKKAHLDAFCRLSTEDEKFLRMVYEKKGMSVRALHKVLRVARTIADIEESIHIKRVHLAEALGYKGLEDKYWKGGVK